MSTNHRSLRCTPDEVFAVLGDGWLFPAWVVGASRMRDVDADWPHLGTQLHHSFGVWPLVLDDDTTVLQWDPPHRFVIQPKGWPLGEARVSVSVEPTARGCRVTLHEKAVKGPGRLVPKPLLDVVLFIRNIETLRRLAYLSEGGAGTVQRDPGRLVPTAADAAGLPPKKRIAPLLLAGAALAVVSAGVVAVARGSRGGGA